MTDWPGDGWPDADNGDAAGNDNDGVWPAEQPPWQPQPADDVGYPPVDDDWVPPDDDDWVGVPAGEADPYPGGDGELVEPAEPVGVHVGGDAGTVDVPVGADPDAVGGSWPAVPFPPPLLFDGLPEPVDGYPWADAGLLGATVIDPPATPAGDPAVAEVAAEVGSDATDWETLAGHPDPATAALARFWGHLDR